MELHAFQKHLGGCRKNPANLPLSDGVRTVIVRTYPSLREALNIRHESGQ